MIRFEQVTRRYDADGRPALDDVTVEFYRGDFAFLIGASGSGKSTLLRMILREGLPQRGKVTVAGQNLGLMLDRRVPDFRRSIGMVFQDFRLLPDKTVFDNVAFAMRVLGAKRSAIRKRVTKVLEKVDLAHLAKRYPHEISGGEQQRAAIARAIVNGPAILLADEPTGNLDPRASAEVMKVLRWINASGTTVIMATHDRAIVDQAQSRVVQLHRGKLVRDEPHGFYDAPIGSEAWEVLAQEEGESGLRAHDPAPLKTGVVPIVAAKETPFTPHADTEHFDGEDSEDSDTYESDLPADQSIEPGEDPSGVEYENDPVLQESGPEDFAQELEHMHFDLPVDEDEPLQENNEPRNEEPAEEFTEDDDEANAAEEDDAELEELELEHAEAADAEFEDPDSSEEEPLDLSAWDAESWDAEFENADLQASNAHSEVPGSADGEDAEEAYFEESEDVDSEELLDEHGDHGDAPDDEEGAGFHVSWPEHVRDQAVERDVPELHGDFNGTELPDLELDGYAEVDEAEFVPDEPQVPEVPLDEQLAQGIPAQDQPSQDDFEDDDFRHNDFTEEQPSAELLPEDAPTGELPPVAASPYRLPPIYPGLTPQQLASRRAAEVQQGESTPVTHPKVPASRSSLRAGTQPGLPQPAPARPRLSWLAHAEDDDAPSNPSTPDAEAFPPEPIRPPTRRQQSAPSPERAAPDNQPPARENADETPARPVPRPKSSASQSTYTDARRTAEHLGISRSRRSILRRLRRDV